MQYNVRYTNIGYKQEKVTNFELRNLIIKAKEGSFHI